MIAQNAIVLAGVLMDVATLDDDHDRAQGIRHPCTPIPDSTV